MSERRARPGDILVAKTSTYEYPQYGNTAIFFVGNKLHCKPHLVTFTGCCRRSNRDKMSAPRIALIEFASQERRKRDSGHHAIAGVDFFSCGVVEWLPHFPVFVHSNVATASGDRGCSASPVLHRPLHCVATRRWTRRCSNYSVAKPQQFSCALSPATSSLKLENVVPDGWV